MPTLPRPDQLTDFVRHRALHLLGSQNRAGAAGRAVAARVGNRPGQAFIRSAEAIRRLDRGVQIPWDELRPVVEDQLHLADIARSRGHHRRSAAWTDLAVRLAYHRSTHYGPLHSPLMLRPHDFLSPFRTSSAGRSMLLEPDPTARPVPPSGVRRRTQEPLRVLILCHSSWTFVRRVEEDLREHAGIEFRSVDVSALPVAQRPSHGLVMRQRDQWNRTGRLHPIPESLEEPLAWADTVFVEWGTQPFAWFSFLDLAKHPVRVVARIHRYECLTPYPMVARAGAYDAVGFVSPPLRTFLETVSPRISQVVHRPTFHNVHSLEHFVPSPSPRRFEIVQIGWAVPTKDVAFSLAVLRRLRKEDTRYVLRLIGPTLEQTRTPATARWAQEISALLAEAGEGVAVEGFRSDVPALLSEAGFILSSSVSEGTHESVAEGAAAGCVPVVRNWPEIAPWGGAAMVYPQDWIVQDVDSAVRRIRSMAEPETFSAAAANAREWVLESRKATVIRESYIDFLRGNDTAGR